MGCDVVGKSSRSVMTRMVMVCVQVARGWGLMLWVWGGHGVRDNCTVTYLWQLRQLQPVAKCVR